MNAQEQIRVVNLLRRGKYHIDSDKGLVYRLQGKPLKPHILSNGHLEYKLLVKGKYKTIKVLGQDLVYLWCYKMYSENMYIIHHNGDVTDNSIYNLQPEYLCPKEKKRAEAETRKIQKAYYGC